MNTSSLSPGCRLEALTVTDLTVDGGALARHEGRVVLLDKGLPGEVVSAEITQTAKRLVRARVLASLAPSPDAVEAWCPHAADCGACAWQHFSPDAAMRWKQKQVRESLARIGKVADPEVFPLIPSPRYREYRNKMAFAFAPDATGRPVLGLRKYREKAVVELTRCGMQPPLVMDLLAHVRERVSAMGLQAWEEKGGGYLRFLVVHTPLYAPEGRAQVLVECVTGSNHRKIAAREQDPRSNGEKMQDLGKSLMDSFPLSGFVHSERRALADLALGERSVFVLGSAEYQERFGDLVLTLPHSVFVQTNSELAASLYAHALQEAAPAERERVWDLYCGAGAMALYAALHAKDRVAEAHGFDIQPEAIAAARNNSAALGLTQCHFHLGALSPKTLASFAVPDIVFLDPPRAGIDPAVAEFLRTLPARRLVYISCDPGTQARDAALLAPQWKALRSRPADMFPYTPHVENILVLDRVAGA